MPQGEGLFYRLLAAVVATVVVFFIVYMIVRSQKMREEGLAKKLKKKSRK